MTADDGNGGEVAIAVTVNLTDVDEAATLTGCSTDLGDLAGQAAFQGAWDDPDCRAHHKEDSPARYVHFSVSEETVVSIDLSGGALFVSRDTPQNGWGTPPKGTMEHRLDVRRNNGKLLHDGSNSVTLTLSAGIEYTVEAAGESGSGGTFDLSIAPVE